MMFTLDQLRGDLQLMQQQKEQSCQQYHQVSGAVALLESQIKMLESMQENSTGEEDPEVTSEEEQPQ